MAFQEAGGGGVTAQVSRPRLRTRGASIQHTSRVSFLSVILLEGRISTSL